MSVAGLNSEKEECHEAEGWGERESKRWEREEQA